MPTQSLHNRAQGHPIEVPKIRVGKELILATKPFARDQAVRSWWVVLSTLALWIGATAGALGLFDVGLGLGLAIQAGCSVLCGLFILRLFVIYHDQQHHAILPRSKAAALLMRIVGILLLSPSSIWKSSHDHHHKHNSKMRGSQIGSFPIMTKAHFQKASKKTQRLYLFMRHPVTILFGYLFVFLIGMCLRPFQNKPRENSDCLIALLVHVGIGAGWVLGFGWGAWLCAQVIPHFIAYAIGTYLFYAQHNFPGVSFFDKDGWTYEKAALESSSYMKTGLVMAWFTANIGYHHIHHLNARVPFYRLPEVWRKIPELQEAKVTSLSPGDIFRCLRLKVWDVETQQMVAL
ncbi:omega-6 fatty acid desaturase (delta-12 desaturase) [Verrucomicrobium sp. GAS474]|uniref:fatty acid desaturase family protein n=1 Tax=Verrucomicrobium sp. GAS474 TaxID=1882831 RepID=UPI00087B6554|nr:fatty acid desaturase [Verrucomicrobium sp. GAS474]SDU05639.1 omega-6 fatty acid desaturase (delta-12 desaturase) [Verrucomicrobium sp. GAS474]